MVVDKPFTLTSAEADDLIGSPTDAGCGSTVFHQRRWDADHLTVRRCVETGVLGRVSTYVARTTVPPRDRRRRWTDEDRPGAGVLYDLGRASDRPGAAPVRLPDDVWADLLTQRPGCGAVDYAHLVLGYDTAARAATRGFAGPGARAPVRGARRPGSLVKHGMDGQIAALLAGGRPGDPGWGTEPPDRHGTLTTELAGPVSTGRLESVPGSYEVFYRGMAAAVREGGPVRCPRSRLGRSSG